jgi:hypothetical protein
MAALIEERGRECNIRTFLDEKDIDGGDSIPEAIKRNLRDCDEFMVLLSRYSIDRPWVLIEIGAAWVLDKRVVAIIDKVTPEEMPDIIAPYKAMDINQFDEFVIQVIQRARGTEE